MKRVSMVSALVVALSAFAVLACSKGAPKTKFAAARDTVLELYESKSYDEMVVELEKTLGKAAKTEGSMVYWFDKDPKGVCVSFAIGKNANGKAAYYDSLGAEPGECK